MSPEEKPTLDYAAAKMRPRSKLAMVALVTALTADALLLLMFASAIMHNMRCPTFLPGPDRISPNVVGGIAGVLDLFAVITGVLAWNRRRRGLLELAALAAALACWAITPVVMFLAQRYCWPL